MANTLRASFPSRLPPQMRTPVLYMDRAFMVLQKPAGLISQMINNPKASRIEGPSLSDALRVVSREQSIQDPLYPVHRLDKATTGALLIARSPSSAKDASQQLSGHHAGKTYLALVRGGEKSFPARSGTIRDAFTVEDGRVSLSKPAPRKKGAEPLSTAKVESEEELPWTDWEFVAASPIVPISLLRLKLHTGHKHQLRVHLASSLRAPVLGDTLHSRTELHASITKHIQVPENRLFLHASQLELWRYRKVSASKRFRLGVYAPLPRDFIELCESMKIPLDPSSPEVVGGVFVDGARATDQDLESVEGYWLPRSHGHSNRY